MIAMILYLSLLAHMGEPQTFVPYTSRLYVPPMDVPAISIKIEPWQCFQKYEGCRVMDGEGKYLSADEWFHYKGNTETLTYYRDGCADTSRVLLTAEDGTRHCIKF